MMFEKRMAVEASCFIEKGIVNKSRNHRRFKNISRHLLNLLFVLGIFLNVLKKLFIEKFKFHGFYPKIFIEILMKNNA